MIREENKKMIIEGQIQTHGAVIKEGKKPYNQIELNGKKFNHFEDELVEKFPAGTKVRVTTEADGKYEKLVSVESMDGLTPTPTATTETTTPSVQVQTLMTISDKPHSYEFGSSKNRHKIYYNTVEELIEQINILEGAGLIEMPSLEVKPEEFVK